MLDPDSHCTFTDDYDCPELLSLFLSQAFVFGKEERKDETIPSSELVARAVGYARELEMIV